MSRRYGNPLASEGDVILPKRNGDRYSPVSPLRQLEPVIVNGSIKIENGIVYIQAELPMIKTKGLLTIAVNLETKQFKVVNGGK